MNSEIKYVATVGFFDGVHAGHRFLIEELKTLSLTKDSQSLIVTFNNHPRKVLNSDFQPQLLNTLAEKIKLLESTGVDKCIVLDFSVQMAQLSAFDFLKTVLKEQLNVKALLVGHDHRFGHNRTDGFKEYQKYGQQLGMEVIQANRFDTPDLQHVSSSQIRLALQRGDIQTANKILAYPYSITGNVISGFKLGNTIGFPTANLQIDDNDKLIPQNAVYATKVYVHNRIYKGMMNIGTRPTLTSENKVSLEVNIFDFNQDIYNETIRVEFIGKIRDERKFENLDKLVEQLNKDKAFVLHNF